MPAVHCSLRTMKTLITTFILIASFQAHGLDTSGCRFEEKNQQTKTSANLSLKVQSSMINSPTCWNANDSVLNISYEWLQGSAMVSQVVNFWMNINGQQRTFSAHIICKHLNELNYAADTSGAITYRCAATARVRVGYQKNILVEIAPQMNGVWDTPGFQKNYLFQF